jgi:quinol monooxygenase YgiN
MTMLQSEADMNCIVTYIDVQPGAVSQALALLQQYRQTSGAAVLQETCRHNRFVIIEAWKDESSFRVHEGAEYTAQFRSRLRAIHNSPYDQRMHHSFSVGPEPEAGIGRFSVVTHVDVPPPRKDETEVLLNSLAGHSRQDKGNVRYDVFQQNAPRTNHFTVFAAWNDENAFASNQSAPHTRQFREALGPLLGAPYDERLYTPLS